MDQTRDIYLTKISDAATRGYYLRASVNQKQWNRHPAVTGPAEKIQWHINTWNHGGGYDRLEDDARYLSSEGMDTRRYHEMSLTSLPEEIEADTEMTTTNQNAKRYFAWFADCWVCAYDKHIYSLTGGGWVLKYTTAETITSLVAYRSWLVVGQISGGYYWSLNVNDYTQSALNMVKLFTEQHLLWGSSAGVIQNCEDPSDDLDWSTDVSIGNLNSDVEGFALLNQQLLVRKKEGLYHYHADGTVTQIWAQAQDTNADWNIYTEAMVNWSGYLIIGDERNLAIWLFDPEGAIIDIHPRNWVDEEFCSHSAVPGDMCIMANYLIMELDGDIYGCWLESANSQIVPRFFKILTLGEYTFDAISCSPAQGIGWIDGYLYYPRHESGVDPFDASTNRVPFESSPVATGNFVADASYQSSGYDQYPDKYKFFQKLWYRATSIPNKSTVTANCVNESVDRTSDVTLSVEDEWTALEFTNPVAGKLVYLTITVTANGEGDPNTTQLTITDMILEGYVVQDTDSVFEFEVLCQDSPDGVSGPDLEEFLFEAATDTWPLTMVAPNGTSYTVRIIAGYPQAMIVADEKGRQQHICRVIAQQVPDATFPAPD